jgi:release factor glutamine methyltransferase
MIISNPPYIPTDLIPTLQPEIAAYEPAEALDGEADGLAALVHIITHAHAWLRDGGDLLLEIGYDQKASVQHAASACSQYSEIVFHKDFGGHDRVAHLKKALRNFN